MSEDTIARAVEELRKSGVKFVVQGNGQIRTAEDVNTYRCPGEVLCGLPAMNAGLEEALLEYGMTYEDIEDFIGAADNAMDDEDEEYADYAYSPRIRRMLLGLTREVR